jgi:hypothetical protein
MALAPSAGAASYLTYVGCSPFVSASPSHVCHIGDEPGAFFKSDTEVEYKVCVDFPNSETICSEEELAEANTLYVNAITTSVVGAHLVTWHVEGVEVASWAFRVDEPPSPAPTPSPAPGPSPPSVPVAKPPTPPTVIGCAERSESSFTFLSHPHRCIEFASKLRYHASELWLSNLHWKRWGKGSATAHGRWQHCGMGKCFSGPAEAAASRPVHACGRIAYTRLKVRLVGVNGRKYSYSLKLPAC